MPTEPDLTVKDLTIKETAALTRQGTAVRNTVITFYLGTHGPFTLTWETEKFTPALANAAIQQKAQELRALFAGLG